MNVRNIPNQSRQQLALLGLVISILLAACTTTAPTYTPVPTRRPTDLGAELVQQHAYPSLSYGIQAFLWWNPTTRAADLEYIRMMRFGYVKQIFGWADIFHTRDGVPDWSIADEVVAEAQYRGIKLIARLSNPPDWARRDSSDPTWADDTAPPFDAEAFGQFCGALATRYRGQIAGYQVWNEPNLAREWNGKTPNAAAYATLLSACYKAIKAVDPQAVVISAAPAPTGTLSPEVIPDETFFWQLYEAGFQHVCDVVGVHATGYNSTPEMPSDDPSFQGNRWQAFRHVEDIRAIMVANGDGAKQIAILEMGWTTDTRDTVPDAQGTPITNPYRWHAVTEQQQADYLVRAYRYAALHWRPWVGLMSMIYIPDVEWTAAREEYWWSIIEPGYQPRLKQALIDLANMERYVDDTVIPALDPCCNPYKPLPPRPQ